MDAGLEVKDQTCRLPLRLNIYERTHRDKYHPGGLVGLGLRPAIECRADAPRQQEDDVEVPLALQE